MSPVNCRLGNKTVPYYLTEEEMLEDKEYTYESLSISEKEIYNNLKNQQDGKES